MTELMEILKTDQRHENVVPLSETEEVRDVLQDALDTAKDRKNADVLRGLLAQLDSGRLVLRPRNIDTK